ncbi:putative aspartic proteinase GIP2 [Heracleum sosnowskyi]|uniref:Aspartic proteinase GIP2 n=1 Tax=Heracleum sosnowskyi TaxID=360622 RepID=A0AAD8M293_9APIA|nr:putative aspartic proteinase GIP2 [Heracleum sosnowskyi]
MSRFIFLFLFIFSTQPCSSHLLAPITKDYKSDMYTISVYLNNPSATTDLLLDLGATFSWIHCNSTNYNRTVAHRFGSVVTAASAGTLALHATDGRSAGNLISLPEFVFSCSSNPSLLKGIHNAIKFPGLAGLGRSDSSLPAQLSSAAHRPVVFALCLSGSPSAPGVAFFNFRGPYHFLPEIDLAESLIYTPLLSSPSKRHTLSNPLHRTDEYFIGVKSIQVNGKSIGINQKILTVNHNGVGGTIISTVTPYTILKRSIYNKLIEAFLRESAALNLTVTKPVKPFGVCYLADDIVETQVGPTVPNIDLVLDGHDVKWSILGSNSMVRIVNDDFDGWCLGFVRSGKYKSTAAIVIGGHQIQDNLLQFDVGNNRLGFTNTVLAKKTMCANFNFTSHSMK